MTKLKTAFNIHDDMVVIHPDGRELPVGDLVSWQSGDGSYKLARVLGTDTSERFVSLDNGTTMPYDSLEYAG